MIVQNTPPVFMQKVENDFCALWRILPLFFVHYGKNYFLCFA